MKMNPCIEDLNDMVKTNDGRYCNSCNKTIIDLTNKSKSEIHQLYMDHNGELCGIIKPDQMHQSKYYHPLKRFALALLIVFGSTLFVFAENIRFDFDSFQAKAYEQLNQNEVKHHIKGFVYANGTAMANAQVEVYIGSKNYIAFSDANGEFDLELPEIESAEIEVNVTHSGYKKSSKWIDINSGRITVFAGKFNLEPKTENLVKGKVAIEEPVEILELGEVVAPEPIKQGGIQIQEDNLDFE